MYIKKMATDIIIPVLIISLILSGTFINSDITLAEQNQNHRESEVIQGEYKFEYYQNNTWNKLETLGFGKYPKDIEIVLPKSIADTHNATIRISKIGGGYGFMDCISIDNLSPLSDNLYTEKKLKAKDLDVLEIKANEPLVVDFENIWDGKISVTARIEEEVLTAHPFFLGAYKHNRYGAEPYMNYKIGDNKDTVLLDGKPANLPISEAFGTFQTIPVTGHPDGNAYIWTFNDDEYMYFVSEWTTDNTYDYGQDYFRVYVRDDDGIKTFTQYSDRGEYGEAYLAYTDVVQYEHMYYKMKVPLSKIKGNNLKLGFEIYGTGGWLKGMEFDNSNPQSVIVGKDADFKINYELQDVERNTNKWVFLLLSYKDEADLEVFWDYNFRMRINSGKFLFGDANNNFNETILSTLLVNDISKYNLNLLAHYSMDVVPMNLPGPKGSVNLKTSFSQTGDYKLAVVAYVQDMSMEGYYYNHSQKNIGVSQITVLPPPPKSTIKFKTGKGSKVAPITIEVGQKIGKLPTPKRKGYIFLGWYVNGKKINEDYVVQDDTVLTAKWTKGADKLVKLKPSTGTLSPQFAPNKFKYKLKINKNKKYVKINAKKYAKKAKVYMKIGKKSDYKKKSSIRVGLKKGQKKTVYIKVVNKGAKPKVYKIFVSRGK